MIWVVAVALGVVISCGTYLALSRQLFRCVVGLALLGNGVNLLVYAAGRLTSAVPAIVPDTAQQLAASAANPLPQALVLTAIVIGFSLLCFSLVLALRLADTTGSDDATRLHASEPPPRDPDRPVIEDHS